MNTYQQQVGGNFKQIVDDIKNLLVATFMTKFGLMMFSLVLSIYFLSLFIVNTESMWKLWFAIGLFVAFIVLAVWNYWKRSSGEELVSETSSEVPVEEVSSTLNKKN
jgi:uncharacterized membrane protein